jgi:histidine triad (HIT) family protein
MVFRGRVVGTGHFGSRPLPNVRVPKNCSDPEFHPAHCKCMPPYDCVFCRIIAGIEPVEGLEQEGRYAVSFIPLKPCVPGHRLFVPIKHATDAGDDSIGAADAFRAACDWAKANDDDFNLITSGGTYATQTIWHTHIHYVPRRENDGLTLPWTGQKK